MVRRGRASRVVQRFLYQPHDPTLEPVHCSFRRPWPLLSSFKDTTLATVALMLHTVLLASGEDERLSFTCMDRL